MTARLDLQTADPASRPVTRRAPGRGSASRLLAAVLALGLVCAAAHVAGAAPESAEPRPAPVSAWVLDRLAASRRVEVLILMAEDEADAPGVVGNPGDPTERRRELVEALRSRADDDQRNLRRALELRGVEHRPFWIVDAIWARVDAADLAWLRARSDVAKIVANPEVSLDLPEQGPFDRMVLESVTGSADDAEPGLVHAGAPGFWDAGFTGQGITVAVADTGVDWDHPALFPAYRGRTGITATHDYHWHDAVHSGGGACGADSPEPCDDYGHGTHVTGIAVGDDGGPAGSRNLVGMAPGAQWIACRNMDGGNGTPTRYLECLQWFLAPTDLTGQNPEPSLAPDVVNNSWYCNEAEGCTDSTPVLEEAVATLRAAGILVVASAGNDGPACGSIRYPPAIYEASLTVGSTNLFDEIASGSSRGSGAANEPSKPDLAAVGVSVRSSLAGGGYGWKTGTSMAAPHVAGAAALVLSACPALEARPDSIASYLRRTALPRAGATCGTVPGADRPNTTYGWGALRMALPDPGGCPLFLDGFESGNSAAWN